MAKKTKKAAADTTRRRRPPAIKRAAAPGSAEAHAERHAGIGEGLTGLDTKWETLRAQLGELHSRAGEDPTMLDYAQSLVNDTSAKLSEQTAWVSRHLPSK